MQEGYVAPVKRFLAEEHDDPFIVHVIENSAILWATRHGHAEIVELLLADERVDPSIYLNEAIQLASYFGYTEIVELLLADGRVDASVRNNWAIRNASEQGGRSIVKILLLHLLDKAPAEYEIWWAECIADDPQALYDRCKEVNDADRYSIVFVRLKQALAEDEERLQKIIALERRVDKEITRPALEQEWLNE